MNNPASSHLQWPKGQFAGTCFRIILCLAFTMLFAKPGHSQYAPEFDEIPVLVKFKYLGEAEVPALIYDGKLLLSVSDFFDFLKVQNRLSTEADSVTGFFLHPQDQFLLDYIGNYINYQNKFWELETGELIQSGDRLFLTTRYFQEVFGINCIYNERSLSVIASSEVELPAVRAIRLSQAGQNFRHSSKPFISDTVLGKNFQFFHFGTADWSIIASEQINGQRQARLGLALGGILAGGELNGVLNYSTNRPFSEKQQQYLWRFADNNLRAMRQVSIGKIQTQSISSIFDPVVGIQVTNAPTHYRQSFSTYTYSGFTRPNWVVGLYINNVLIDYLQSDASGLVTYNIPLEYGTTQVSLRYNGPWGEEHQYTQNFNIPFSLLPKNVFEYRVSAGRVEDKAGSIYSQGRLQYGLSDKVTVGAGLEYLSSIARHNSMPFLNASYRATPNLLFSGEYTYGVRRKGSMTYQLPSGFQLELNYMRYEEQQEAIRFNYKEERRMVVSMPIRFGRFSAFSRLAYRQNSLNSGRLDNAEWMVSMAGKGMSINMSNYAFFRKGVVLHVFSNLSSSIWLPGRFTLNPRLSYDYTKQQFLSVSLGIERFFSRKLALNASYEQRFDFDERYIRAGISYDFSFARFHSTVVNSRTETTLFESAGGSVIYEKKLKCLDFMRQANVGRGGVSVTAFVDINGNGKRDIFETTVQGLNVKIDRGAVKRLDRGNDVIFLGLEPFVEYHVTLDGNNFENLAWKIEKRFLSIVIEPNKVKKVEIPVSVMGEAAGMVFVSDQNGQRGIKGIKVEFYNKRSELVATTMTESDGYFSYLGLKPGKYTASLDKKQLEKLKLKPDPANLKFSIRSSQIGDVVDSLEFNLEEVSNK